MKSIKRLLVVILVLSGIRALASQSEKVISLKVGESSFFTTPRPILSVENGPLQINEKTVAIYVDTEALARYLANFKEVEHGQGFYRERRNFREAQAQIRIKHADGSLTTKNFSLALHPQHTVVALSEKFLDIEARLMGTVDQYKCFNADTCVHELNMPIWRGVEENGSKVSQNFSSGLVGCHNDARIWAEVDHPEIQRIDINPLIARPLRLETRIWAKAKPVPAGEEFQGFVTSIAHFGKANFQEDPGAILELSREGDTLKLLAFKYKPDGSKQMITGYDFRDCGF